MPILLTILKIVLPTLTDDLLKGLFGLISTEITRRNNIMLGQRQQAAAETAQSLKTEDAMLQAATNAPKTDTELTDRLQKGTF